MVFVKDANELRFVLFNRAGEELLGYSREEMIGKNDYDFFPKEEADFFTAKDREVLAGKTLVEIAEEPIHTRTKGTRILHTKKIPILDENREPVYLLGISEDITELKEAERKLRQTERLASIGTLAAGIAHEINNPVGAILLAAQMASRFGPDDHERRQHALQRIVEQSERCGHIVRSVLQFARQESTEKWLVDINTVVARAKHASQDEALERGSRIVLELEDGLPQVEANPTELEQVIVNLVRNSLQSREQGVTVVIRTMATAAGIRVAVTDDGPGMSKSEREHMFDPFFTSRQKKGGTGLGLSIARGIVESHGGTIEAQSEHGEGATVTIELPRAGVLGGSDSDV